MGETILNEAQMAAVSHRSGPALVLAGPGSGKTTVITHRSVEIAKEIERPCRLLSVTFTRAAGIEMAKRYRALAGAEQGDVPVFQTVHAFCNGIIGQYERATGTHFTRMEEGTGKMQLLSTLYTQINHLKPEDSTLAQIQGLLARNHQGSCDIRNFDKIRQGYTDYKKARKLIDFDDMITMALRLLQEDAAFCKRVADQFDYIQVDEAQDLSASQYELIRLIAPHRNLFVVADDDQSIYRFRGAEPDCVFDFAKRYADCVRYDLTQNYRSTGSVVSAAAKLVGHNEKRFTKNLYTTRPKGEKVQLRIFGSGREQTVYIGDYISKKPGNCAILYRNTISALSVRLLLTARNVPYEVRGGLESVWEIQPLWQIMDGIRDGERQAGLFVPSPEKIYRQMIKQGIIQDMRQDFQRKGLHQRYLSAVLECVELLVSMCATWKECIALLSRMDAGKMAENEREGVILSTIHSAKGLEFDTVYMVDLLEGEFPGSGATTGDDLEEERRLFYVGMTRAKERLFLCYPLKRGGTPETESRFVQEAV